MPKVIVFHLNEKGRLPKLTPEQGQAIKNSLEKALQENPQVKYNGTYVNAEGIGICDWEAPDAETVEKIVKEAIGAPYDAVVAVEPLQL